MQLNYLGPTGTFSEAAAHAFALDAPALNPCDSIARVVERVAAGDGAGVVPYYNLIDGLVQESLDRILHANLRIHGALQLPVSFTLGGSARVTEDAPIYSHAKALAQCSDYLDAHHAHRPRIAVASTAEGVARAVAEDALAVASRASFQARRAPVVCEDVTNRYFGRQNYTEFLLIDRVDSQKSYTRNVADRCVLACAPQTDRPGLLADLLGQLAFFDINLARIHSRPAIAAAPTTLDPQVFYFEIAGAVPANVFSICAQSLTLALGGNADTPVLFDLGQYALTTLPA
ncbi:MAG: prephenate dehydratase [Gammaproteobacteria bacterium]